MNSYIKHIIEAFDFDSVNKQKKSINAIEMILQNIINKIINNNELTADEKEYVLSLPVACYKTNNNEIKNLIIQCLAIFGNECDLNWIDTSEITNMSRLFFGSHFNGNISKWDVSNVTNMEAIFFCSDFNGDISNWNVSNVTDMRGMFCKTNFNKDISNWDVSNVTDMGAMFAYSKFNRDINNWDVSNVIDINCMFKESAFTRDISNWNINLVCDTHEMFDRCSIKEEYKPKCLQINEGFDFDSVNKQKKPINAFRNINQILQKVRTCNIKDISKDEYNILTTYVGIYKPHDKQNLKRIIDDITCYFGNNCNLNWINTSEITDMSFLFKFSFFNGDISLWDVSNVTDMTNMFSESKFNGDISKWDVSNVMNMVAMFQKSYFNKDISSWDVSNVTEMNFMFYRSNFNKDISNWNIHKLCRHESMFDRCPIKDEYKPDFLKNL